MRKLKKTGAKGLRTIALERVWACMLTLTLVITPALIPAITLDSAAASSGPSVPDVAAIIEDTAAYLIETIRSPGIGQVGGEWMIIGLVRSSSAMPEGYVSDYYERVVSQLDVVQGLLSSVKYSEYSRLVLALAAIGADPRDIGGYDLLAPLLDYDKVVNQGLNGPIFAVIALGGAGYGDEPVVGRYLEYILSRQLDDGGFTLAGSISDPDTTAMALTALSGYSGLGEGVVPQAATDALARLSNMQRPNGGFSSFSSTNSESVSQAIIALSSLGIPVNALLFMKEGNKLLDNLMTYYIDGQGFEHERGGGVSVMATEQALCALAALWRYQTGQNTIYDMSDAPAYLPKAQEVGLAGKHPDVSVPDATGDEVLFTDVRGHENENAIVALAERGIVTGYSAERFSPEGDVTRAEFAAMIVRALGLDTGDKGKEFIDVPPGSWFYDFARIAYRYGIIEGRSENIFDPSGLVTRQEAAVMASRAAALCGLKESFDETAIRNVLSQFIDYRSAAAWASEALALCYYFKVFDDFDLEIHPAAPVSRAEAAEIAFRILGTARLL